MLYTAADFNADRQLEVRDRRLQHLLKIHRAQAGDEVRVGEIDGQMGSARIEFIDENRAILNVTLSEPPFAKLPLTLIVALPRPKMLRRILRTVAECGVAELHLINSYRVEKSYWQTPVLQEQTTKDYFLQGLEQSRDTVLPRLELHHRFKPFVEDQLTGLIAGKRALLAHPGDYPPCPAGCTEATAVVIGPEGGFIPYEAEKLIATGCLPVSMGPRILRVETAVSALLGRMLPTH
ncbi:MAG: RsmE family RNA methyltransferase [Halieaceae bacterium]|jgi:RsmE family RNA methyltransferase